jgi:hypothetical protein
VDGDPIKFVDADSSTLLVTFGGIHRNVGIPMFEFRRMTEDFAVKRLFVRDSRQAWYHRGLPGYSTTLSGTMEALEPMIEADHVVATGNSAGAYAALVFGSRFAASVIAFCPQTTLNLHDMHRIGDRRWDDHLKPLFRAGVMDPQLTDLAILEPLADAHVYFDQGLKLDRLHAERIAHIAQLHPATTGGHELVKAMRDTGTLAPLLKAALSPEAAGAGSQSPPEAPVESSSARARRAE